MKAYLLDIATYKPDKSLTNIELEDIFPGWPAEKILEKTGISERRIAAISQTAGDMAYEAARNLFSKGKVKASDVDFVILSTQTPDYILPATACILQNRLGISCEAGAIDINIGCSGYVYGLSLANGLIESGAATCVLLLTSDTYSKYIHPLDKSVRTLFGDGATASIVVAKSLENKAIGPFVFGTDGSGAKNLIVEAGMHRLPRSAETQREFTDASENTRTLEHLYMNGGEVMAFSLREVPRAINSLLNKSAYSKDDIDYFVLHQANKFMLEALRRKLNIQEARLPIAMEMSGNTVSSTIPFVLSKLITQGVLEETHRLMLVGFGVGYSWAACILNFGEKVSNE